MMTDIRELTGSINTIATAFRSSLILYVANDAQVFAHLETPTSADTVAQALGWTARSTRMLLDALVAIKLVEKCDGQYRNTLVASTCLVPDTPHYQGHIVKHNANTLPMWLHLAESVRSGQAAPCGENRRSPEELRAFILGMSDIGKMSAREMTEILDLSEYRNMLDVGGGPGTYTLTFLQTQPAMRGTVFDRPEVLEIAREQADEAGLADRMSFHAGDLTKDSLGEGYDFVLVSNIIHSYSTETNRALVQKCFDALVPGGTLIIKDFLTDNDRSGPAFSLLFALHMLVATGEGGTYSFDEVKDWTASAGFGPGKVLDLSPQTRLWIVRKP